MQLVAIGVDFHSSPLALRERLAVHGERLELALRRLRSAVPEGFLLSTCNRTEIYGLAGHAESGGRVLSTILADLGEMAPADLAPNLVVRSSHAVVQHLFGVASGTESMVTGEFEILAQLKSALARAAAGECLGPATHRLGSAALAVGKRVRNATGIARHALSVVSIALAEAEAQIGPLKDRSVLIVGAGHTAELALKHLAGGGAARRCVVARDESRSAALAWRLGATTRPWTSLTEALGHADLVVSCTRAPGYVIDRRMIEQVQIWRERAPLLLADLATPRDVDPRAADVPGVTLFDIDRVEAVAETNRALRVAEVEAAEAIITEHVNRYFSWFTARQVAPTTTALVARATAIRDAEIARALAQMPGLAPSEERAVRALASRLVNKLIHVPLATLGSHPEAGNMAAALRELFQLSPVPATGDPAVEPAIYRHDVSGDAGLAPAGALASVRDNL